jgi:hypothetical protein
MFVSHAGLTKPVGTGPVPGGTEPARYLNRSGSHPKSCLQICNLGEPADGKPDRFFLHGNPPVHGSVNPACMRHLRHEPTRPAGCRKLLFYCLLTCSWTPRPDATGVWTYAPRHWSILSLSGPACSHAPCLTEMKAPLVFRVWLESRGSGAERIRSCGCLDGERREWSGSQGIYPADAGSLRPLEFDKRSRSASVFLFPSPSRLLSCHR